MQIFYVIGALLMPLAVLGGIVLLLTGLGTGRDGQVIAGAILLGSVLIAASLGDAGRARRGGPPEGPGPA